MRSSLTVDATLSAAHHSAMVRTEFQLTDRRPNVVGSFGGIGELQTADATAIREICDIVEVRLDLVPVLQDDGKTSPWSHLNGIPLLFTARRFEEGGALVLSDVERMDLLEAVLGEAACIDIEVASMAGMKPLVETLASRGIPWIASFHDFEKLPETRLLEDAAARALDAGASAFKAAASLHGPADVARLAEFQLADRGLPVATMGMGVLAPVSRILCAQCGSVLNYGYLGTIPTAPGQWDAAFLKQAITRLAAFAGDRAE